MNHHNKHFSQYMHTNMYEKKEQEQTRKHKMKLHNKEATVDTTHQSS